MTTGPDHPETKARPKMKTTYRRVTTQGLFMTPLPHPSSLLTCAMFSYSLADFSFAINGTNVILFGVLKARLSEVMPRVRIADMMVCETFRRSSSAECARQLQHSFRFPVGSSQANSRASPGFSWWETLEPLNRDRN